MQIIKKFNPSCTDAAMLLPGVFTSVDWDDLLPAISKAIVLRSDEVIDGFIVSEAGIKIKLSRKRIRKAYVKKEKTEKQL